MKLKKLNWPLIVLVAALLSLAGCKSDSDVGTGAAIGGDLTEKDTDGDGFIDLEDNCPFVSNADQSNIDGDESGDACDADIDGDGVDNQFDQCPNDPSDLCDPTQVERDSDGDGILDSEDNCPTVPNEDQLDTNGDGVGDACTLADGEESYACGVAAENPYKPLVNGVGNTVLATETQSGLCVLCSVSGIENVVDQNLTNSARISLVLNVEGTKGINIEDSQTYPAPNRLGVALGESAGDLLSLELLPAIVIETKLNGVVQETFTDLTPLDLDLLGLLGDASANFAIFDTMEPFNAVEIRYGGVNIVGTLDVIAACASSTAL